MPVCSLGGGGIIRFVGLRWSSNYLGLPPDGNEKSIQVIYFETFKVSSSDVLAEMNLIAGVAAGW